MLLARIVRALIQKVYPIVSWLNSVAMVALAAMMFLTAADVALRYSINKPIVGSYELTAYLMVVWVAFAIGETAVEHGHINVDIVVQRMKKRPKAILLAVTNFLCIILFATVAWRTFVHATKAIDTSAVSAALQVPEYPFIYLCGVGLVLLTLVFIVQFLESRVEATGQWNQSS